MKLAKLLAEQIFFKVKENEMTWKYLRHTSEHNSETQNGMRARCQA